MPTSAAPVSTRSSFSRRSRETTPLAPTALSTETVEVTDPTHALYGLELPLLGITTQQRLGRVCRVWLQPGIERAIPIAATTRVTVPSRTPSRACSAC